jgi:phospholipid/cholesterol/gamma-HCH transport system substrate-binding protein
MENRAYALIAGIFLLVLGGAIAATAWWFQGDSVPRAQYTVVARMAVAGLNVKAPVKLRGVEVGKVEAIAFDAADPQQILVTIAVDAAAPLARGTVARLGLQGVTGLSFIDLDDSAADKTRLAPGSGRIELQPTLLDRLAVAGPQLLAGLNESTQRVNRLLGDANQAELQRALAQLGTAAGAVQRLVDALQPTARALPGVVQRADALLQRGEVVARRIDSLAGDAGALTQDLRARLAALDRLGGAAQQIEATTRRLEAALVGADAAPRTRPLVDELAAASRALERAAADLGEQPQSLVFGRTPPPPGPGESGYDGRARVAP